MEDNIFEAKFIGFNAVKELKGDHVARDAYAAARAITRIVESVIIQITNEGVRVIEALSGDCLRSVTIKNISHTCAIGDRKEIFSFISNDERLCRISCHMYDCGPRAYDACVAIGNAFKLQAKKIQLKKEEK